MAREYLNPSDPGAFQDHEKLPNRMGKDWVECPTCKGHGGWNLKLNQYYIPYGYDQDDPVNQKMKHFRCGCSTCSGWGWVHKNNQCEHEWYQSKNLGRCYNEYTCSKCGRTKNVDSSD